MFGVVGGIQLTDTRAVSHLLLQLLEGYWVGGSAILFTEDGLEEASSSVFFNCSNSLEKNWSGKEDITALA